MSSLSPPLRADPQGPVSWRNAKPQRLPGAPAPFPPQRLTPGMLESQDRAVSTAPEASPSRGSWHMMTARWSETSSQGAQLKSLWTSSDPGCQEWYLSCTALVLPRCAPSVPRCCCGAPGPCRARWWSWVPSQGSGTWLEIGFGAWDGRGSGSALDAGCGSSRDQGSGAWLLQGSAPWWPPTPHASLDPSPARWRCHLPCSGSFASTPLGDPGHGCHLRQLPRVASSGLPPHRRALPLRPGAQ
mmetsp:Transcript_107709/g.240413  ORF Transcript_107709/g.240413 Transcript_107709/m.240413 type:complete len:243 (-) Transcript_107709:220-948(-)